VKTGSFRTYTGSGRISIARSLYGTGARALLSRSHRPPAAQAQDRSDAERSSRCQIASRMPGGRSTCRQTVRQPRPYGGRGGPQSRHGGAAASELKDLRGKHRPIMQHALEGAPKRSWIARRRSAWLNPIGEAVMAIWCAPGGIAPGAGYRAGIPIRDDLVVVHREPGHRLVGAEMARDLDTVRVGPFFRPAKSKRSPTSRQAVGPMSTRKRSSRSGCIVATVTSLGNQRWVGVHRSLTGQ
jgi:hypothetical protein